MELEEPIKRGREMTDENGFYHRHTNYGGRYREIRNKVEEKLDIEAYETLNIVDIGTSKGRAIDNMVSNLSDEYDTDFRTYAADISQEHVEKASEQDNIDQVLSARIENLPFQNDSMDLVICNGLLPYLPEDPEKVEHTEKNPHYTSFQEIHQILDRDGIAAVEEVNRMPYEQQYLLDKKELGEMMAENDPEEPLRFEQGDRINQIP